MTSCRYFLNMIQLHISKQSMQALFININPTFLPSSLSYLYYFNFILLYRRFTNHTDIRFKRADLKDMPYIEGDAKVYKIMWVYLNIINYIKKKLHTYMYTVDM